MYKRESLSPSILISQSKHMKSRLWDDIWRIHQTFSKENGKYQVDLRFATWGKWTGEEKRFGRIPVVYDDIFFKLSYERKIFDAVNKNISTIPIPANQIRSWQWSTICGQKRGSLIGLQAAEFSESKSDFPQVIDLLFGSFRYLLNDICHIFDFWLFISMWHVTGDICEL